MKEYIKPIIEDEEIVIEDICTTSMSEPKNAFDNDDDKITI